MRDAGSCCEIHGADSSRTAVEVWIAGERAPPWRVKDEEALCDKMEDEGVGGCHR